MNPPPAERNCPLDDMAARRAERTVLTREELDEYILAGLRKKIASARQNSPFYKKRLFPFSAEFPRTLEEYASLPFTLPADLAADPLAFLAMPQDEIFRIVTLPTSGSTGAAKRLFFTEDDLGRTMEIFREGMTLLAAPGDRVLVLLPGERPGSIGDLLVRGLAKGGMECECLWPPPDEETILKRIAETKTACIVSLPALALSLARHPASDLAACLKGVLLSADYAADSLCEGIAESWKCRVLRHYALTELGYGGALECPEGQGFHVMEGDFFFEILDPEGRGLSEGAFGEIVVTPFTLEGTSLLR
ncbi:MAG: phenylacetate--CoA ligase family protein, partial [Synergistaceae bacterium]|nr:phenylacetate--CoA ligase family protein [Synergistaceae bacterium]